MRFLLRLPLLTTMALVTVCNTSCGTIVHGSNQALGISSNPTGATVSINGEYEGVTPLSVDLKRSNKYHVTIEK